MSEVKKEAIEEKSVENNPINDGKVTESMAEVISAAQEIQDLETRCEGDSKKADLEIDIDAMRSAFYNTSLNLFEAAKALKPYDILYTDGLLSQAQYFLNLADNYDTLHTLAKITHEMPLSKLPKEVPGSVIDKIDDYSAAIKTRMATIQKTAEVPDEVTSKVEDIAKNIQEKLNKK